MTPDRAPAAGRPAAQGRLRERPWTVEDVLARYGLGLALLLLIALFGAMSRAFLTADNALSVLRQVSTVGIMAVSAGAKNWPTVENTKLIRNK